MTAFSDERMAKLYERFILEYYRQNHPYLTEVKAAQVKWDLVGEHDAAMLRFLPAMQTDIFLRFAKKFSFWMPSITARHCSSSLIKRPCILPTSTRSTPTLKNQDAAHTGNVFRAASLRQNAGSHHAELSLQLRRQSDRCTHLGSESGFSANHRTAGWNCPAVFREASALIFSMSIYPPSHPPVCFFKLSPPKCPKEKEDAIVEALRHFQMI